MKKITFLLFLLMSSLSICQNTNTANIKCFPEGQVNEMYKGLKQGEYLKTLQDKTEKALDKAQLLITEQKSVISKQTDIISGQDKIIANSKYISEQDKVAFEAQKEQLQNDLKIQEKTYKRDGRKKFWRGVAVGGVTVSVVTVAGLILLKN